MMLNHFVTLILFQIKLWMILTDLLYLFYFIYFIYNKTKIKINLFVTDLTKLHVKLAVQTVSVIYNKSLTKSAAVKRLTVGC